MSVFPETIFEDAGYLVKITGIFDMTHRYHAHIGDTGTILDAKMHSGLAGQGFILYPWTATILRGYTPRVINSAPLSVYVQDLETLEEDVLAGALQATPRCFHKSVFELRKVLPSNYKVGIRGLE
jgi:hypothetical protein